MFGLGLINLYVEKLKPLNETIITSHINTLYEFDKKYRESAFQES